MVHAVVDVVAWSSVLAAFADHTHDQRAGFGAEMSSRLCDHSPRLILGLLEDIDLRRVQLGGGEPASQVENIHIVTLLATFGHAGLSNLDGFAEGGGTVLATATVEVDTS